MSTPKDSYTKNGAGILAATIATFWQGKVTVERYELPGFPGTWGVRSDMVNGLPPGHVWRAGVGAVIP